MIWILLHTADYVSIHAPLTAETRGMIDARTRRWAGDAVVQHEAPLSMKLLFTGALQEGLDRRAPRWTMMAQEPPRPDIHLLALENVIVTPTRLYSKPRPD